MIKGTIFNIGKKLLPEMFFQKIWAWYVFHNKKYQSSKNRMAYFLSSQRSRKKYCIFRYAVPNFGIMAVARNILFVCEWAEKNHLTPIIDMEWGTVFEKKLLGIDNCWEYIFKQDNSIANLQNEKYVFVGTINERYVCSKMCSYINGDKNDDLVHIKEKDWKEYYKKINYYSRKWWILRKDIQERFFDTYDRLFDDNMKIMGVPLREEFSICNSETKKSLSRHPNQPNLDEIISAIRKYKEEWKCTHIFVATYMEDSIKRLQEEFGQELLYTKRRRVSFEEFQTARVQMEKYIQESDKEKVYTGFHSDTKEAKLMNTFDKNTTIEYVEEIYGLSLCKCLLGGKSGGTIAACIWNGGKFEHIKILEDKNASVLY